GCNLSQTKRLRLADDVLRGLSIGFWRCRRSYAQQLIIARYQVAVFIQIADNQVGGLAYFGTQAQGTQLPSEVVGQIGWLGKKVLKRRPLDLLHFAVRAIAGIEIVLEERAEINLFERIFLFDSSDRVFFVAGGSGALAVLFFLADFVEQRNSVLELFEDRVLDHLGVDHVLELQLVERKDGNHLHQAGREDLALRKLNAEFVLQ